jgi:indolepyruvate ferredoxin oxidoreductase beta subunit
MSEGVTNIIVTGVGGQGVLKATDILSHAALEAGHDVKSSVAKGMSRRGGRVTGDVRFGPRVLSPLSPVGETDYIVVIEASQTDSVRGRARPGAPFIHAADIDASALPSARALNLALLGRLSTLLTIPRPPGSTPYESASLPNPSRQITSRHSVLGERVVLRKQATGLHLVLLQHTHDCCNVLE